MKKKQLILVALVSGSLMAASQARAQLIYNDNDLLLNFRESVDDSGNDAEVDLGPVATFVSAVAALPNGMAVLDSGTNYATSSYTPRFNGDDLISLVGNSVGDSDGSADNIGFSAAAENTQAPGNAANTIWLTRVITASEVQTGGTPSVQVGLNAQDETAQDIEDIGYEAESPANEGSGIAFAGAVNGAIVTDSDPYSYHTLARSPSSPDVINYGGTVAGTIAGPLEATPASGPVYEALWEVPVSGEGTDVYMGYFEFQTNGELDFTVASAAKVPPPQVSLTIVRGATNSLQVLWPTNGNFTLQQSTNLAVKADWITSSYPVTTVSGTNSITISTPTGDLYFRLIDP